MRRAACLVLLTTVSGCVSVSALEHSSLRHEQRARLLAERGDGEAAAREQSRAVSDREAARRRAEHVSGYWQSEVLLQ